MISRKVSSQGFELDYLVPGSTEEYNALAPKRDNPVLEDAVQNTLYRNVLNVFRDGLVTKLEEVTKVTRINNGTEEKPVWESEGKYIKRVIATVAGQRGLDQAAKATADTLLAEWQPLAQEIMSAIPFDPSERESTGGGSLIGKNDLKMATEAIDKGKGQALASMLSTILEKTIVFVGTPESKDADIKSLALGLKDRRAKIAKAQEEADKAALGI